jgi:hypothetical protein
MKNFQNVLSKGYDKIDKQITKLIGTISNENSTLVLIQATKIKESFHEYYINLSESYSVKFY